MSFATVKWATEMETTPARGEINDTNYSKHARKEERNGQNNTFQRAEDRERATKCSSGSLRKKSGNKITHARSRELNSNSLSVLGKAEYVQYKYPKTLSAFIARMPYI